MLDLSDGNNATELQLDADAADGDQAEHTAATHRRSGYACRGYSRIRTYYDGVTPWMSTERAHESSSDEQSGTT